MAKAPRKLKAQIGPGLCNLCPRHQGVKTVCMVGSGPTSPDLVVVGEAPAGAEDQAGRPLIGPSGQLLRKALAEAGFDPERIRYTNVVRCGNAKSGNPSMTEVRKCRMYLLEELQTIDYSNCRGIILLGQTAVRGVLDNGFLTIKEARLRELDKYGPKIPVPIRCTYHTAAALPGRNPALYDEIVEDLKSVFKPREAAKPIQIVNTPHDLEQACPHPTILGLDLEWTKDGAIRLAGVSDGCINAVCPDVKAVLHWLKEVNRVQT